MRVALRRAWPNLSHFFGLKPWELGLLRHEELISYLEWIEEAAEG